MIVTIRPRGSALGGGGGQTHRPSVTERDVAHDRASAPHANYSRACELKEEGNQLFLAGRFPQAAEAFTTALKMCERGAPLQAALLCNRSAAYCRWGQFELAAADAQASIIIQPKIVKAYFRLGQALKAMGQHEQAAYVCGEWAGRECTGASAGQLAQLRELRDAALARAVAQSCAMSTRLSVRSPQSRSTTSDGRAAGPTALRTLEILTVGDGGVLLQTLANVLHIPRARLKVICSGKVLKDASATASIRSAAARSGSKLLVLHVLGEPSEDESDVDAQSVDVVSRQLGINRREAVTRVRVAGGDVLNALLL